MGYGPDPDKCKELLRKKNTLTLRNHDNAVAFKADCQCGYRYKHLPIATREYTWGVLDQSQMEYLRKLPLVVREEINGKKLFFIHAGHHPIFEYIKPETPSEAIMAMLADPMEPVDV
ncbi:hypothetical protein MSSAC_3880 [Methanosarcina siciliae C2J]|uniref:Uncharacterized protein n=1 Tax=Methanosarcina siciliae C2J TaxID=1434118 RepID=A0A0E3PR11_9EURY|nr:hypothetical protein [Methanosarcina siciliae]AKB38470.1 hypothetical protein MSSAC_3880 [Methanosarcina siciliae C2J]